MENKRETQYSRKKRRFPVILRPLLLAAVLLAGALLLAACGGAKALSGSQTGETAVTETVSRNALTLLIDETDFLTGSESWASLSVLYREEVREEITVTDENGQEICRIGNDGSGYGDARVPIPTEQDGCIRLQAVSGEYTSNHVSCYIHPEITAEMVGTLAQVSEDMGAFVQGQNFDNPLSQDALERVKDYLLSDPRVADARINEGAVLYATTDSLMGSYGLGAVSGVYFGDDFSDPDKTYRSYTAGGDVSGETLKSTVTLTNKKLLYLSPLPEDQLVWRVMGSYVSKVCDLADAIGGDFSYAERDRAWELLETGQFTDAGFLMLVTHGKRLVRSDGTTMFCFAMGQMDMAEFQEVFIGDQLNADSLWGAYEYDTNREYLHSEETYRLLYDYNPDEPESAHILFATTNYLESVLHNQVFDNTIIYFCVCHSAVDEELISLFLSHGAGAYIGSVPALNPGVAYSILCAFADVLGNGGCVAEVLPKAMGGDYNAETVEWHNTVIASQYDEDPVDRKDVQKWWSDNEVICRVRDSSARTVLGTGTLSGSVVDSDGAPVEDATVTIHHWLDHGYETLATVTTDEDGYFELVDADWGLYGITAEKAYGKARVPSKGYRVLEFSPECSTAEPIVLRFEPPMVFSAEMGQYNGTLYMIGDGLDAEGIHIEGLPVACPEPGWNICGFAFYGDQLYFCCKGPGSYDFASALWVCDADGGNARKLRDNCFNFYIQGGLLRCWDTECYSIAENRWIAEDLTTLYYWGSSQYFTMDACIMDWPEDGVYAQDYSLLADGSIDYGPASRIFSYPSSSLGRFVHLVLATDRYLFLDGSEQNTARFCCYDLETGTLMVLDEKIAAGSGYYFSW